MNTGDIAFVLICSALVLLMTPALSFFYGGLGRRKNVLNTMMMTIFVMGVSSVLWIICGYSLSFSGNHFGIIGDFRSIFLMGLEGKPGDGKIFIYDLKDAVHIRTGERGNEAIY